MTGGHRTPTPEECVKAMEAEIAELQARAAKRNQETLKGVNYGLSLIGRAPLKVLPNPRDLDNLLKETEPLLAAAMARLEAPRGVGDCVH
jgi:hypothetical protein